MFHESPELSLLWSTLFYRVLEVKNYFELFSESFVRSRPGRFDYSGNTRLPFTSKVPATDGAPVLGWPPPTDTE